MSGTKYLVIYCILCTCTMVQLLIIVLSLSRELDNMSIVPDSYIEQTLNQSKFNNSTRLWPEILRMKTNS